MGTPPWANDQDRTINFAKAVTGEAARLATMGASVELSGSARADWLQERLNEELIPFLRDMVDVGCAAGMFLLKPAGQHRSVHAAGIYDHGCGQPQACDRRRAV